jgi:PqqD family protein of HPr-rel-A system
LPVLISSFPQTLRHEVLGQLHAVFDCVSGRTHLLAPESWEILNLVSVPRSREGHIAAIQEGFDVEVDGTEVDKSIIELALNTRLDELLRLGLAFPYPSDV